MKDFPKPEVLQCIHFVDSSPTMLTRAVKDYEFDLFIDGEREMFMDGRHYHLSGGSLVFRKPGQVVSSVGDYNAYILTIDFEGNRSLSPEKYIRSSLTPLQKNMDSDIFAEIPEHFYPHHLEEIKELYKKIISCSYPNIINTQLQEQYISELIFLIISDAYRNKSEMRKKEIMIQTHVQKACEYINKNYSRDISVEDIAKYVSLNKNYLIRLFKNKTGKTPSVYITETRLFHARLMLVQSQMSVKSIALSCGFNTPSYFIKKFKEKYEKTPIEYKMQFND